MNVSINSDRDSATAAGADILAQWLTESGTRNVMLAAGNTPLDLYRCIGEKNLSLSHLTIFSLDEYVGVPLEELRNCANIIRKTAVVPWGVSEAQYYFVSSLDTEALASVQGHEQHIENDGGLDVLVLGLGQNGHLGFNEPGSEENSSARVFELDPISIEANRKWFRSLYAPVRGATVGMKTILATKRILIMAFGTHKTSAVKAMLEGPRSTDCPASLLQDHPNVHVFIDLDAAEGLA